MPRRSLYGHRGSTRRELVPGCRRDIARQIYKITCAARLFFFFLIRWLPLPPFHPTRLPSLYFYAPMYRFFTPSLILSLSLFYSLIQSPTTCVSYMRIFRRYKYSCATDLRIDENWATPRSFFFSLSFSESIDGIPHSFYTI